MHNSFFLAAEAFKPGERLAWDQARAAIAWSPEGLLPVITQCARTGQVLMMAWMNAEALEETRRSGWMCYWSRSRGALWRKGETSGHRQRWLQLRLDCDGDALLAQVEQQGPACHTGRPHCFYWRYEDQHWVCDPGEENPQSSPST
jgi:phosphoribosyl-AMP cyclohydrolase